MKLQCYIVDNEDFAIAYLAKHTSSTPGLELAGTETNPLEALRKISNGEIKADICFLDIEMPQLSGLDLAALIQPYTHIIFTTAHEHFALKAFDTNVIDYLLKPIEYPRFLKAIQKVQTMFSESANNARERTSVFIQSETKGKMIQIKIDDIFYVGGAANYVRVWLNDNNHLTYHTLKEMENILPQPVFVRVHKSNLINVNKVDFVEGGMIHLLNGTPIPLGSNFKKDFWNRINGQLIKTSR